MKMPQSSMNMPQGADPSGIGQGLFTGLTTNSNFNDVAEFEIYDRKFKQQASSANKPQGGDNVVGQEKKGKVGGMYDTPSF